MAGHKKFPDPLKPGNFLKACKACGYRNNSKRRLCFSCHQVLANPATKKPSRTLEQRRKADLEHANKMASAWGTRVKRAVSKWDEWTKKATAIQARINEDRDKAKPVAPTRSVSLGDLV